MQTSKTIVSKKAATPANVLPTDMETPINEFAESAVYAASSADAPQQKMVAEAAYFRAERRGFEPGHELEDWLAAEAEVVRSSLQRTPLASDVDDTRTEILPMLL